MHDNVANWESSGLVRKTPARRSKLLEKVRKGLGIHVQEENKLTLRARNTDVVVGGFFYISRYAIILGVGGVLSARKCDICGTSDFNDAGTIIETNGDRIITICPLCHDDVYRDGARYSVDVMIVPVSEASFIIAKKYSKYIIPVRYVSPRKKPKFIAFYRGGNIKAITHISRVLDIKFGKDAEEIKNLYLNNSNVIAVWKEEKEFYLFEFTYPQPLKYKIVRNDEPPIQNRTYKSFKTFVKARYLKDLYQVRAG